MPPEPKSHPHRPAGAESPPSAGPPETGTTVYVGLGANLGDRANAIRAAVQALSERGILRQIQLSPLYETEPMTPDAQPLYLNAVVRGETDMPVTAVLASCLAVEVALGRVRPPGRRKAPRLIDIDILLYGSAVIDTHALKVPHPGLLERAFVLIPLADVAVPGLKHPVTGVDLTLALPSPTVTLVPEQVGA